MADVLSAIRGIGGLVYDPAYGYPLGFHTILERVTPRVDVWLAVRDCSPATSLISLTVAPEIRPSRVHRNVPWDRMLVEVSAKLQEFALEIDRTLGVSGIGATWGTGEDSVLAGEGSPAPPIDPA